MAGAANRPSESAAPGAAADSSQKISGGNLVAKALKNEGVEAIFTLCGGHIIDIYDGCLTRASRSSTCATSRSRPMPPTATGGSPARRMRGGHRGAGHDRRDDRGRQRVSRREPDVADRRPGRARQHQMGSLQDLPHVEMMATDYQVRGDRAHHGTDRRHGAWRSASASTARPDRRSWRSRATSSTPGVDSTRARIPAGEHYRASTKSARRSARRRTAGRHLVKSATPMRAARYPGLDMPGGRGGDRVLPAGSTSRHT